MRQASIALGSIFLECNHFGGAPADLDTFRRSELLYGNELLDRAAGTIGGALATLNHRGVYIRPLLVASACPSAPVVSECYQHLKNELLDRLEHELPVDGVLLALHGAAAVENLGHLESDLLAAVRRLVGHNTPIVATLDLHAHVTEAMVAAADALLAWETYPHRDAFETGQRGALALLDIIDGRLQPTMALAKVPVLVSGVRGHTEGPGPFADVMRFAKSLEGRDGVYSTSAFLVHPYLDLPQMGGGGLVITHEDSAKAASLAAEIASLYWERRFELEPPVETPVEAIRKGLTLAGGPVVLVETADCCGGGAAGDSVATLRTLIAENVQERCLVPVVDPVAAARCHQAGIGAELELSLGHHVDKKWGEPIMLRGTVRRLSNGRFIYRGGIWDRQPGHMGPSARFDAGSIQICIASHPTYDWRGEQYELLDMDARSAKFVVVKNPMNYRLAYGDFLKSEFILETPGPTPPTLRSVKYSHVSVPFFPAVTEIPDLIPTVVRGRR